MATFKEPKMILFSQHGMKDTNVTMGELAQSLALADCLVVAPNLGYVNTLFEIEPLIETLEREVKRTFAQYPEVPARVIATSLGGVIWVEVLTRHPEWWSRIESIVLLGSPIGGADLARMIDPFGWGIGIAKYLGQNRRPMAEKITAVIPTLVVAGNYTGGGDATVPIESTKLKHAHFVCLYGVIHRDLRKHPAVIKAVQEFWSEPRKPLPAETTLITELVEHFRAVPGITDASERDFVKAKSVFVFNDGTNIRTWTNPMQVQHVFIANTHGQCEYSGFVGWVHSAGLQQAIDIATKQFH